jgi:hypothetical protein
VASLIGVHLRETTALLAVFAEMSDDEALRTRARRELERRSHSLPPWLARLSETEAYRTAELTHILPDGDDVFVGARLSTGHDLTALIYIDYNLGNVVKDAFVLDVPIGDVLAKMETAGGDPDIHVADIDPASARARITEAIDNGALTFPPFETDTWPISRPLVEWITRMLADGGTGWEPPEWSSEALHELTERFFTSPLGASLDDRDHRSLLETLLWFGTDYGSCDPLHWSAVRVELLLADWLPRKVVAGVTYLSKAPGLLRAWIRFCHEEQGIRADLTEETLAAVDKWQPVFMQAIRTPRPQGVDALLVAAGVRSPEGPWTDPFEDEFDLAGHMLDTLARQVGGFEALDSLNDQPLPDEAFSWEGIPDDIRSMVGEIVAWCDRFCDESLDVEYRTACRRLLARVAAGDPAVFRRRGRAESAAAAVCWIVGKANSLFRTSGMLVKDLAAYFGLPGGGVSQRATTLLRAGGFETEQYGGMVLGSPDYLVSARRRRIIDSRDRYREMGAE